MTNIDTRILTLAVWGGGTLAVYSVVLVRRVIAWRRHRDVRSRREVLSGFALWLTAFGAAFAIALVLFQTPSDIRGLATATALGAFFAAGLVMVSEESHPG